MRSQKGEGEGGESQRERNEKKRNIEKENEKDGVSFTHPIHYTLLTTGRKYPRLLYLRIIQYSKLIAPVVSFPPL